MLRALNTALDNKEGVAGMSLSDGTFNIAAQGESFGMAARVELPEDGYSAETGQGLWRDLDAADPMEMFIGRQIDTRANLDGPDFNGPSEPEPAQQPGARLQTAFHNARDFQRETVKLEAGVITAQSGPGARSVENYNNGKQEAVQDLRAAAADFRKEAQMQPDPAPSQGGGVIKAALSAAAGVVADAVVPGSGVAMTVAAIGAGTFGVKNSNEFASPAADGGSVYQTASGYDTVDIMGGPHADAAPAPRFSMGDIDHIVEPSLEDTRVTFGPQQLAAIEAVTSRMDRDLTLGTNAYRNWLESDVDVTQNIGDAPATALKVKPEDQAKLTSDNPALREEPMMAAPRISAMRLA